MRRCSLGGLFGKVVVLAVGALVSMFAARAAADVAYTQPPNAAGGQYKSAWYSPDGLDSDEYVWDAFTLASTTAITEVQWRGAYTNYLSGAGKAPVYDFTVSIHASTAANSEPDVVNPPLVRYHTNGNAGETPAGTAGGVAMYDYHFVLPSSFQAVAGTKYWIQIEAYQGVTPQYGWPPDWSIAQGTGGEGSHFHRIGGTGGSFGFRSGDCAFTLLKAAGTSYVISADINPVGAGAIMGAGSYPANANATLTATANAGYGFFNWTENGTQVSTNSNFTFAVTRDRSLVANFIPAYSITTNSLPSYGGTASGGGVFNENATVTLTAVANPGFQFSQWSWYGWPLSTDPVYAFPATLDMVCTAEFVHTALSTTFTIDDAPVHTSLPVMLTSDGITATFSGGYSVQPAGTMGFTPAGFEGLCIYPNSINLADLTVDFDHALTFFSIMYSPQELGCDNSATIRVTAFMDGVQVGTNTATVPVPGTWPTGTVSIVVPAGFNRAVVHYDHRPPTCQDYGVIFLADNCTVTTLCSAVGIASQPTGMATCPDGWAVFWVAPAGAGVPAYQWQREASPGVFVDLADGPTASWDGGGPGVGGIISGANTDNLTIYADLANGLRLSSAHSVRYRCVVSNPCSTATSDAALLSVCPADFNCDGFIDPLDYNGYINEFEAGSMNADFNRDGFLDPLDYNGFINAYEAGC